MATSKTTDKLQQFNEFFTIEHNFNINISLTDITEISDYQTFLDNMPAPFKMIGYMTKLDQATIVPLQTFSGVSGQLVNFLNLQAQKIDLLMSYILNQQDDENLRHQGKSFGGGGISFLSTTCFNVDDIIELKIFIQSENCTIYCFGEIIESIAQGEQYLYKVLFYYIRDEDRELLVRTSLHKQSKQLQQLAKQRKSSQES